MRVLERSVYRGPNRFGGWAMVRCLLDLEELAEVRSNAIPGLPERLLERVPELALHHCGRGHPGGFVERLHEGTLLGHVAEHVALAHQVLAGDRVSRGKTRRAGPGSSRFHVLTAYESPTTAFAAMRLALELVVEELPDGMPRHPVTGLDLLHPPVAGLEELSAIAARSRLGPTTRSLAEAARRRRIPVDRVDELSLLRFGYGARQRTVRASITDATTHLAVLTAGDKAATKRVLAAAGVPVPAGAVAANPDEVIQSAVRFRRPLVVKPLVGNHGRGVSLDLHTDEQLREAYRAARSSRVIVEEQVPGSDHRVLVVGGRTVAVAERLPASVVGDGATPAAAVPSSGLRGATGCGEGLAVSPAPGYLGQT